jgi:hypothetical protein
VGPGRYFGFLIYLRAVGLLGRVISSSQGLYLNTRQHKHRKTHIHTIKHPCPRWDSNPQSRPPRDRRLFMPQTARLPRPANATLYLWLIQHYTMKTYKGVDVYIHVLSTSTLVRGERSVSRPFRLTLRRKSPRYPSDRWLDWPQNRYGLHGEKPCLYQDSNSAARKLRYPSS